MSSVARRVARTGTGILVASLATIGLGTGTALHVHEVRSLDRALLAAAHGQAHPEVDEGWEVEHSRAPVDAWVVRRDDPRVPAAAVAQVVRRESVLFLDAGDRRLALLPVEDERTHRHLVVAAAAPRVTPVRSVGSFAVAYLALSSVVAGLAAAALGWTVRVAFAPVRRAREEAEQVLGFGQGARLTEDAPTEVQALLVAINGLLGRLDAAWAAQGRFTAEAAHELRTPVAAMLGELDVALRREHSAEEYRDVLRSTRAEVRRLARIVEALTALARLDAGEAERGRQLVRAREVAAAALHGERLELERAGCPITLAVDADPELEVNPALVELALANLLRNVARHAPGGPVVLRVRQVDDRACFDVEDRGPGVAEPDAMFDRFARAGASRSRDAAGLGLGLPLAREVARRHGGDCVLTPAPGGGTRATLCVSAGGAPR